MTSKVLHVLAVSNGSIDTGWVWLTVPRLCMFGTKTPEVTEWDYGIMQGSQPATAIAIARKAREIQGLEYRCGPVIITDDQRLHAMLELLQHQKLTGDSQVRYQHTAQITDDRLRELEMHTEDQETRAATKHALFLLKRARADKAIAHEMWPYPASGSA